MSALTDELSRVEGHIDYTGRADIPDEVFDVLRTLVADVDAMKDALTHPASVLVNMTRADALEAAREHVEAMSTRANGYQDARLSDKVSAVDRLARFLMGESE